jgi:DNA-binding NarL/FixJ family response regulator
MNTQSVTSPSSATRTVRILVADDHEVMRLGIRNLLEAKPNWTVCAEAGNGQEAIDKARLCAPDLIIMDITMPVMNGLDAAYFLMKSQPDIPILLFSLHLSDDLIGNFAASGIRGAVCKGDAARDLVDAVQAVLSGGSFFPGKHLSRENLRDGRSSALGN